MWVGRVGGIKEHLLEMPASCGTLSWGPRWAGRSSSSKWAWMASWQVEPEYEKRSSCLRAGGVSVPGSQACSLWNVVPGAAPGWQKLRT